MYSISFTTIIPAPGKQQVIVLLLLASLATLTGPGLQAQGKWSLGISSQLMNTRLMTDYANPLTKGAYRPAAALFTQYSPGGIYTLQAGLGYTMLTQNSDAFKNNFHYLALPFYVKLGRNSEDTRVSVTSFCGTNLHYLLSARHLFPDGTEENILGHCQRLHMELAVGAGLKFRVSERYTLETLYSVSVGTMINKNNEALMDVNNWNNGLVVSLSYRLQ